MAASMGHATKLALGTGETGPTTRQYEFISCGLIKESEILDDDGIRDGRSHDQEGTSEGQYTVGGSVVLNPRADDLDELLDMIGTETTDVWALDETQDEWFAEVETVGDVFGFTGLKANQMTFRSSASAQELQLEIDLQGKTMTTPSFTDQSATLTDQAPWRHRDLVFTYDSNAIQVESIEITINNALILDRFLNSQTRTELPEGDRIVTVAVRIPYTSTNAPFLLGQGTGNYAATAVWTHGAKVLTFTFVALQFGEVTPTINARGEEVGIDITFTAYEDHSVGTKELVITNVDG